MLYPNKIFTLEYTGENSIIGRTHLVIVIAASSIELAKAYVKARIGVDTEATWLQNAVYPTIYVQNGSVPHEIQAKVLSNCSFHV